MHVAQREDMFEFWGEGDIDWNFGGGQESTLSLPSYDRFVNCTYFFSCFLVYWHFSLSFWCSVLLKGYSILIMLFLKCGENWRSNTICWTHLNYSLSDDYCSANEWIRELSKYQFLRAQIEFSSPRISPYVKILCA